MRKALGQLKYNKVEELKGKLLKEVINHKPKRQGKTKGATSFVQIPLRILNKNFKEGATITISRKFAEANNLVSEGVCVGHSKTQAVDFSNVEVTESEAAKVQARPVAEIAETSPDFRVESID